MKSFKQLVSEVAQPKSEDEINFKAKHEIEKFDHPHAKDVQFDGGTKKAAKRRADYDTGNDEKVYEAMDPVNKKALSKKFKDRQDQDIDNDGDVDDSDRYLHARRKAISKAIKQEEAELEESITKMSHGRLKFHMNNKSVPHGSYSWDQMKAERDRRLKTGEGEAYKKAKASMSEEVEQIDEISKKTLSSYVKKASDDMADNAYTLGARDPLRKPGSWNKAFKRRAGIAKATDKLAKEEVEQIDEISKKTLGNYIRKASDDRAQNALEVGKTGKINFKGLKRRQGINRATAKLTKEEVEQLDELSPNTLHSYIKKAAGNMAGNAAVAAAQASSSMKKSSPDVKRKIKNRMQGITGASGRLADKANMAENAWEEIPMMQRQLQFIEYAAGEISDYLNMGVDPEEWFQNKLAGLHQTMLSMYAYAQGEMQMTGGMYGEETELDESQRSLDAHKFKQAAKVKAGIPLRRPGESLAAYVTRKAKAQAKMQKEEAELDEASPTKKAITRALQGMKVQPKDKVSLKKAPWEKNEDLDEVTRSAVKRPEKYTDARGVTRYRLTSTRPVQHDEYGQEKIRESLEEAVKPGRLKLDDGSNITVSKKDADLVNQMFNDLNAKNRKKMQDTMMSDKDGFDEIVGFAREAM